MHSQLQSINWNFSRMDWIRRLFGTIVSIRRRFLSVWWGSTWYWFLEIYPFVPKKNPFLIKRGNKEKTVLSRKPYPKSSNNLAVPHNMLNCFRFVTNHTSSICKASTMKTIITAKLLWRTNHPRIIDFRRVYPQIFPCIILLHSRFHLMTSGLYLPVISL